MSWIILALTLGASITSMIHGVFMLFGSLSISGSAIAGIPSTLLASLPIISAIFALIGGIIAFNRSKWGALFLFIATGICVPTRDTWLYAGLYFFAALLCFFLKSRPQEEYSDMLYDDYDDTGINNYNDEDYYTQENNNNALDLNTLDEDIVPVVNVNREPPRIHRRTTKSCPTCGDVVPHDAAYCPTCGTKLFTMPGKVDITPPVFTSDNNNDTDGISIQSVNEQLLTPVEVQENFDADTNTEENNISAPDLNFNANDGDEMSTAIPYRLVRPQRNNQEFQIQSNKKRPARNNSNKSDAAASYQEFSKYTRRGKKRRRSAGRKILSMLLLVGAVGGALYFLLGLRKLPPGDLPPMVRPEVVSVNSNNSQEAPPIDTVAEPVDVTVTENILPNFTPDREPSSGVVNGTSVNVRADHTTSSTRVTRLNAGTRIEIIGSFNVPSGQYSGIWYNVRTGGREGWIYGRYVMPLGFGLPSGYSNALLKSFGGTRSELVETLGQPSGSTASSARWSGISASLRGDDVTSIRLTSSNRELQNGLKTGMSQTALFQIMGYPSSVRGRTMNYNEGNKTGLSVELNGNNAITSITVNEI